MTASGPARLRSRHDVLVSVVLPVFNEVAILRELTRRIVTVMEADRLRFEIVYVNDGSADGSRESLNQLAADDGRITVVHFSRNFGHQPAVHAALDHAAGDVVVLMDSDLQDDPQAIPRFLDQWECGFDVVYAQRVNRKEHAAKRMLFYSFYRILNAIADSPIPADAGNFGLMDRKVVNALRRLPECDRFLPGLRSWAGFRQTGIPVERAARHDDNPRVSLRGLFRLAKTAIFSFSAFPLKFFYVIAAISAATCAGAIGFVLWHKAMTGLAVPGWASTIITASFFGALNALGISILGEYVIRIFDQVRNRPVYLAEQVVRHQFATTTRSTGELTEIRQNVDRLELLLESLEKEYRPQEQVTMSEVPPPTAHCPTTHY